MPFRRFPLSALLLSLAFASALPAQTLKTPAKSQTQLPPMPKPPALVEASGPAVTLQTSEALFDVAAALNVCGYDAGLAASDPVRQRVRDALNQAVQASPSAGAARDELCTFIGQHRLYEGSRDLAQYISLALYLTPPPALAPSVEQTDLPPDATQVVEVLPILRRFAEAVGLHLIFVRFHPEYEAEVTKLHDPLTKMILDTDVYLKEPTSSYNGRRFLVVLEPLLDPGQTNARVYGADYVVVASPVNGTVDMHDVRHTYLHYEIEPLLYAHATALDRLLPLLKTVRDAPLEYQYPRRHRVARGGVHDPRRGSAHHGDGRRSVRDPGERPARGPAAFAARA